MVVVVVVVVFLGKISPLFNVWLLSYPPPGHGIVTKVFISKVV